LVAITSFVSLSATTKLSVPIGRGIGLGEITLTTGSLGVLTASVSFCFGVIETGCGGETISVVIFLWLLE